jgi:hypothetical protein
MRDGYTSEQERQWMKEWENNISDSDEEYEDSIASDLVKLQEGQL